MRESLRSKYVKEGREERVRALVAGTAMAGIFHDHARAVQAVKRSAPQLSECGFYPYLVLEKVNVGITGLPESAEWFKLKKAAYKKCAPPVWAKGLCGFCL